MRKPLLVSDVLRFVSPRKAPSPSFLTAGRSDGYRENLGSFRAQDQRPRTNSFKRKQPEGDSYAAKAAGNVTVSQDLGNKKEELLVKITMVKSVCDKISTDICDESMDAKSVAVFSDICSALRSICEVQEVIVRGPGEGTGAPPPQGSQSNMVVLGTLNKRVRTDPGSNTEVSSGHTQYEEVRPEVREEAFPSLSSQDRAQDARNHERYEQQQVSAEHAKFKEAVKLAERSTLIFNLNMGRAPIMNKETMAKQATLSLAAMAAEKEGKKGQSKPSEVTLAVIDDVLSMSTGMTIFGNTTKTYSHPRDKNSGSYCTLPVRYEFEDKDTRFRAEKVLRDKCGVQCTTPYLTLLRECINQMVRRVKNDFPDDFVKVTVDANNFGLRVSRKPPDDAPDPEWKVIKRIFELPREALDVDTKRVPEGFRMIDLPTPSKYQNRYDNPVVVRQRSVSAGSGSGSGSAMEGE
jgi:hypothetical protein